MAIYDRDLELQKLRAAKQGQWMDSMAAFGNFINQRQELQQNAPYKEALAKQANAMSGYYDQGGANRMVPLISGYDPKTGSPIISGMVPKGTIFDPSMKAKQQFDTYKQKTDYSQQAKSKGPMSGDVAGRYAFAQETVRNSPKLLNTLFPDGTPQSFRQDIANKLFVGKFPKDKESQEVFRWLNSAMAGRGLIQSGVVLRPDEMDRMLKSYGIDFTSDPEAAYNGLNELVSFNKDFMSLVRPGGDQGGQEVVSKNNAQSVNSTKSKFGGLWS